MTHSNRITSLTLALVCSAMVAQESTGTLTGTVRNKQGQPVPNATVRLTSPKLLGERLAVTDAKGSYRIPILPVGNYAITFTAPGHVTNKGAFSLQAQTLRQDGVLVSEQEMKTQEAVVQVVAQAAQVDKTETVTQTNFSPETLESLQPSNIFAAVNFAPGVSGEGAFASIRGGIGAGTSTIMNGGNIKSGVKNLWEFDPTIPDMVESVSVIQSPMNARYGGTDGGVISWVTSRGSNEFAGSLRRTFYRDNWDSSKNATVADRLGAVSSKTQASDDNARGEWQVTLKGPIWKDHVTFAYASRLLPTSHGLYGLGQWETRPLSYTDIPNDPTNTQSTYFQDPTNGTTIRKSQLSPYDGQLLPTTRKDTWNQYALYYQINTNHQIEYGYTSQFHSDTMWEAGSWTGYGGWPTRPLEPFSQDRHLWNLAYRGLIGSGVLEIRAGGKMEAYKHPTTSTPGVGSWVGQNQIADGDSGAMRLPNNILDIWLYNTPMIWENGAAYGDHDTLSTWYRNLSYQQVLHGAGTHIIDVGVDYLKAGFENKNVKDKWVTTTGHIASTGVDPQYAGKFIVIPYNATIGDITGGSDYTYNAWGISEPADLLLRNAADIGGASLMTRMRLSEGSTGGDFYATTTSYYANDQWTLNDHHSLMFGLRLDAVKVWDGSRTIHTYSQPSPRFEYKWDLAGDQRRIVNFSWGRFTESLHSWYFQPYAQGYLPNHTQRMWTGENNPSPYANPRAPYLVDLAALTDPGNYTYIRTASVDGGVSDQLNPNVKGPQSEETTLGFRRSFENGSYYRATLVYKKWRHLLDYASAPQGQAQPLPNGSSVQVLPRYLQEDANLTRQYKSFETEWNFVFTRRVSFGGNYTYSRLTTNDLMSAMDNPMAQGKGGSLDRLWTDYQSQFNPASNWAGDYLQAGGHVFNGWFTFDMGTGKLKQTLVLRGKYAQGQPFSESTNIRIPYPTVPGYDSTANLPSSVPMYAEGKNGFTHTDSWAISLHYNLEVPIYKKLAWFCDVDVSNCLNTIARSGYSLAGYGGYSVDSAGAGTAPQLPSNGFRLGTRDTRAAEGYFGYRNVTIETGIRF